MDAYDGEKGDGGFDVKKRIAIVAHVFYEEIWPEIKSCIDNFVAVCGGDNVDVFLTYPEVRPQLAKVYPPPEKNDSARRIHVAAIPNRGYDIGAFFHVLERLDLREYDFIVKLHTKRDAPDGWLNFRHYPAGPAHRQMLLSFCSTEKAAAKSLAAMRRDPTIGMLAARPLIDPSGITAGPEVLWRAREVLAHHGLPNNGKAMVYGTMFMVRARLLEVLKGKVDISEFPEISTQNPHDVGMAGAWESAFGIIVEAQGFRVAQGGVPHFVSVIGGQVCAMLYYWLRRLSTSIRKMVCSRAR